MRWLLNWLRRDALEHSLDRELQYHLDRRIDDLVQTGVPEAEARRRARLELGGPMQVREEVRDVWLTRWLRDFVYDLRFSARSFLRSRSFTAAAVASLAIGIGATTAIYSLVDQVMLQALPVRAPERLVLIDWRGDPVATGFGSWNLMSYPLCRDLQLHDQLFDGVLCRAATTVTLSTDGGPEPTAVEIVSGTYFAVLGVGPALGRVLVADDDQVAGADPVVVLAYDFWRTRLGGDPAVVGRTVLINQHPATVVGVAAPTFRGIDVGEVPALWMPASMSSQAIPGFDQLMDRRTRWMQVLGRLKPDVTRARAETALQPWFKAMLDDDLRRPGFPRVTPERRQRFLASRLELTPAAQGHSSMRRRLAQPLWVLFAATGVLLGLACLNVAGLFVARGSARDREIRTRLALGASRGRIGRQLVADSLLVALAGGVCGVALAPLAMRALIAFLPRETAATALHARADARLLAFALAVSVAAGVVCGLVPAWQTGRDSLVASLRERGGTGTSARLRKVIVAAQFALSLMLVIAAVLFARTLIGLLAKGPGFDTTSLVSFGIEPRRIGYAPLDASRLVFRIHDEVRAAPTTEAAAVARFPLLTGGSWNNQMTIQSDRRITTDREVNLNAITPGFFATLGARIVSGRDFDDRDARADGAPGPRAAIVNEAFVARYLAGRNPLGTLVCLGSGPDAQPNITVVGVVATFSYRGLREESEQLFFPMLDGVGGNSYGVDVGGNFYVRVRGTPGQAAQAIRSIVHDADPALPITDFRTVDEQVGRSLNTERLLATLCGAFGALALLLSLVGLTGVMSFLVTQRTREIGIRMALGARGAAAVWLVLRDAVVMIAGGAAIALPCIGALGRVVESQLFGVTATDPITIGATTVLLAAVALVAALVPACGAATVNPTDALRAE
jgi:putative ABC transport system permease protein